MHLGELRRHDELAERNPTSAARTNRWLCPRTFEILRGGRLIGDDGCCAAAATASITPPKASEAPFLMRCSMRSRKRACFLPRSIWVTWAGPSAPHSGEHLGHLGGPKCFVLGRALLGHLGGPKCSALGRRALGSLGRAQVLPASALGRRALGSLGPGPSAGHLVALGHECVAQVPKCCKSGSEHLGQKC